jgi:hypothetical protein
MRFVIPSHSILRDCHGNEAIQSQAAYGFAAAAAAARGKGQPGGIVISRVRKRLGIARSVAGGASPTRTPAFAGGENERKNPGVAGSTTPWQVILTTTVEEIESPVAHLQDSDLGDFQAWFVQFDAEAWDREFEEDAQSGKLDRLADKALAKIN